MSESKKSLATVIDDFNGLLVGELLSRSGSINDADRAALKRLMQTLLIADDYIAAAKQLNKI